MQSLLNFDGTGGDYLVKTEIDYRIVEFKNGMLFVFIQPTITDSENH